MLDSTTDHIRFSNGLFVSHLRQSSILHCQVCSQHHHQHSVPAASAPSPPLSSPSDRPSFYPDHLSCYLALPSLHSSYPVAHPLLFPRCISPSALLPNPLSVVNILRMTGKHCCHLLYRQGADRALRLLRCLLRWKVFLCFESLCVD